MRSLSPIRRMVYGTGLLVALATLVLTSCSTLSNPLAPPTLQAPLTVMARALTLSPDAFTHLTLGPA
ncbi:MAG: hypothetical protein HY710_02980, partial [Candidatus Latescibacteria bacterium]|nr:hypothetical protein [Candidatus Latescibacterota bacterium]